MCATTQMLVLTAVTMEGACTYILTSAAVSEEYICATTQSLVLIAVSMEGA
jgi:hypothetical protein